MSIDRELRRTFELASLKREAKTILTAGEWQTFRKIEEVHDAQRHAEERRYRDEYDTRVETERRRLIDAAGTKGRSFTHRWAGADRFDKDAIERQARRAVQEAHHRRLTAIDDMRAKDLGRLLKNCERSRSLSRQFQSDFSRAAYRRMGIERRAAGPSGLRKTRSRRREP